jgi:hypothetical protein
MEVNTNLSSVGAGGPISPRSSAVAAPSQSKLADGTSLSTLDEALQNLPASRSDSVQRALSLISDSQYPPLEVIDSISKLMAGQLGNPES